MLAYVVGGVFLFTVIIPVFKATVKIASASRRKKTRGRSGEATVDRCLRKFKRKGFTRFRDVMLPTRSQTAQIDNILVSPAGIFVIETKNYGGTIKGQPDQAQWVQRFPGSKQPSREFFNPIWQNNGHIRALRELLGSSFPHVKYHNVVVFSNNCVFPDIPGVVSFKGLKSYLKREMKGKSFLSENDVENIKSIIERNNITNRKQRSEHVAFAKKTASRSKQRELDELVQKRTNENKSAALALQELYSQGRLDEQIRSASSKTAEKSNSSLSMFREEER